MYRFYSGLLVGIIVLTYFSGCGGEADYSFDDISTLNGKFIDDAVEGLEYRRSNGDSSITAKGGSYSYRRGELISFHVGALTLGTSDGSSIITPRELAENTDIIEDPSISNRVRLMLALDSNAQRIGIQIDPAMRASANNWKKSIDFSKSESAFLTEVAVVTNGDITALVAASTANDHFAKSLRCAYRCAYQGAWEIQGCPAGLPGKHHLCRCPAGEGARYAGKQQVCRQHHSRILVRSWLAPWYKTALGQANPLGRIHPHTFYHQGARGRVRQQPVRQAGRHGERISHPGQPVWFTPKK